MRPHVRPVLGTVFLVAAACSSTSGDPAGKIEPGAGGTTVAGRDGAGSSGTSSTEGGRAGTQGVGVSAGFVGDGSGMPGAGGRAGNGASGANARGGTGSAGAPSAGGMAGRGTSGGTAGGAAGGAENAGMGGKAGAGVGGAAAGSAGSAGSDSNATVCGILATAGNGCAAAHSTTRVLYPNYTGPLYQVCKGTAVAGPSSCTSGMTKDIGSVGGIADAAAQDTFCSGGSCTISIIYDQSPNKNDLKPAPPGGAKNSPDNPASATALKTTLAGHAVYGVLIKANIGYRSGCTGCDKPKATGTATADQAETQYMVTSQKDLIGGCCFDYGNAETSAHDDGEGTMEAVYFGNGVVWGTGSPGGHNSGQWVMADLENGLFAGWENNQDQNISTNTPLKFDFITALLVGDVASKNGGKGRFALYGGDATNGPLKTEYDGVRPTKGGYVPMKKQGSVILGIGGDNSNGAGGRWYEGVMANGAATTATLDALQANIVAAKYGQ